MTTRLEDALRDELSARAADVPASADIADIVIARARRTRRRQRIAAAGTACVVMLFAAAGGTWWLKGGPEAAEQAAAITDATEQLGEFSVLTDDAAILTGTGEFIHTGLTVAETAVEVHGGWVVSGVTGDEGERRASYIGYDGEIVELMTGDLLEVHPNERGDRVAVASMSPDGGDGLAVVYAATTGSRIAEAGRFDVPAGMAVGGVSGAKIWLRATEASDAVDPAAPGYWMWDAALGGEPPAPSALTSDVVLLESVAERMVLARTTSDVPTDLCVGTLDLNLGDFTPTSLECFSELSLSEVVVGPDGEQALGYVEPLEPTETDPGEWVWLPVGDRVGEGLEPTGFRDFDVKPFFTYHDVAFYDPDGDWYSLEHEELGIPQLAGIPIPISHVPR
ncbi:hypothetical protein LX16_3640 [Stackebrandtia albiflava]|uniref:Uncharacterized protein n=1 Tax=Stackebrandtia albiflava TaxID=406432 RepID=A0A562V4R9_9ACTN|nr:hypothetical protein [Stackebrandtia albiflava]TWJ12873.1 hypothetical protein LX16_3640 [Stackebrandtia albiflava]